MTHLKLSEAIREGAKLRPQGFDAFFQTKDDGVRCSCALGAAFEAMTGMDDYWAGDHTLRELFPTVPVDVFTNITAMNDASLLSREEIADQVEAWGY